MDGWPPGERTTAFNEHCLAHKVVVRAFAGDGTRVHIGEPRRTTPSSRQPARSLHEQLNDRFYALVAQELMTNTSTRLLSDVVAECSLPNLDPDEADAGQLAPGGDGVILPAGTTRQYPTRCRSPTGRC